MTAPNTETTTIYGDLAGSTLLSPRAASVQATSLCVTSASFGTYQAAWQLEVTNTLIALNAWKGAA